jgi:hypothetical protein
MRFVATQFANTRIRPLVIVVCSHPDEPGADASKNMKTGEWQSAWATTFFARMHTTFEGVLDIEEQIFVMSCTAPKDSTRRCVPCEIACWQPTGVRKRTRRKYPWSVAT